MNSVGIVNYGVGNIRSIANAFLHLGKQVSLVSCPDDFSACSHIVLPGVGAFGYCAERLTASGLESNLAQWALEMRRPLLGICVGMQLLYDHSSESPEANGLSWLGGEVKPINQSSSEVRVPHVGWNSVTFHQDFGPFKSGTVEDFYFDHSYFCSSPNKGSSIGTVRHGQTMCAVSAYNNIVAAQFHPEKSQQAGIKFLQGFLDAE